MTGSPNPLPRIALKELRESLRDRRTTVTLVLMPLLVYPLLGVLFRNVLIATNPEAAGPVPVVFENEPDGLAFMAAFARGNELLGEDAGALDLKTFRPEDPDETLERIVSQGRAELGVRVGGEPSADGDAPPRFTLLTRSGSPLSVETARRIAARLRAVNDEALRERLRAGGLNTGVPAGFETETVEAEGGGAVSLATVVPLILLLMTATGAVYPAIDTTAGERERGTLETLIAAPVSRFGLLMGKFVAVWAVAVLTAGANLIAMTATVYAVGLDGVLFGEAAPWRSLPAIAGLLALTAGFFAAVLLAVTSAARSFKEAQAYLIPLMLCCLAPGGLALAPSVRLDLGWAAAPLVNLVLLARETLAGTAPPLPAAAAVLATICYAGLALSVAARIFGTDAILYGGPGGWAEFLKPPRRPDGVPPLGAVLLGTLGICAAYLVLGSLPGRLAGVTADPDSLRTANLRALLLANALVAPVVFVGLPWLVTRWSGGDAVRTFALRLTRRQVVGLGGGLLMGLGSAALLAELLRRLSGEEGFGGTSRLAGLAEMLPTLPLPLVILCLAVVPAVCEEFAFRGLILTGLKVRFGAARAILVSGVIFGLFHFISELGLWQRLIGTTALGFALGWVRVRTGSLWPGVALHATNNALILWVAGDPVWFAERFGLNVDASEGLPPTVLIPAALLVAAGAAGVWWSGNGNGTATVREPAPSAADPPEPTP